MVERTSAEVPSGRSWPFTCTHQIELTLRAVPLSPVPAELAGTDRALAHEWAPGPVGVTEVSVRAET